MIFNDKTYFKLLGVEQSYEIDCAQLEQRYFALQMQFHPDRFSNSSGAEKVAAASQSTTINDAYKTLKDDLHRAEYLLFLHDITVNADNKTGVQPCKILLAEAMEMREELMEAETAAEVQKLEDEAIINRQECIARITKSFANQDIDDAAQLATRMRYLYKFVDEIRLKRLAI